MNDFSDIMNTKMTEKYNSPEKELNPIDYPEGGDIVWFQKEQERVEQILQRDPTLDLEQIKKFGRQLFDWALELNDIVGEIKWIINKSGAYSYDESGSSLIAKDGSKYNLYNGMSFFGRFSEGYLLNLFNSHNNDVGSVLQTVEINYIKWARYYLKNLKEKNTVETKKYTGWFGMESSE